MSETSKSLLTIANLIPALISRMDTDLRYTFVNQAYERWFNVKSSDLIGKKVKDFVGEVVFERALPHFQKALKGETVSFEQESPYKSGTRNIHVVYTPEIDEATGKVIGVIALVSDISAEVSARNELLISLKKLEEEKILRERFVETLTHDLRSPLTAVKISSQMTLRRVDQPNFVQEQTVRVLNNIERIDQMIQQLLDANTIRAGHKLILEMDLCDLSYELREAMMDISTIHGDRFIYKGPDRVEGYWNRLSIKRIIENLANNAIKYGGNQTPVTIKLEVKSDIVLISVHNSGNPININDLSNIFDHYGRTQSAKMSNKEGWGLGLSLVKAVAEAHGGSVAVTSSVESGTLFTVELPFKKAPF